MDSEESPSRKRDEPELRSIDAAAAVPVAVVAVVAAAAAHEHVIVTNASSFAR